MTRKDNIGLVVRCGFLAVVFSGMACAQAPSREESVSINDPRPLAKAAEILRARYGVPVSYEDVSAYNYYADLADPVDFGAAHPEARVLPPRSNTFSFMLEPLQVSYDPAKPADSKSVARVLQGILDQHAASGNPGRFNLLEMAGGLVIVPTATRDINGAFVPDHSILDDRITFPEISGGSDLVFGAFRDALQAVTGKPVHIDVIPGLSDRVRADNEPARDVLVRLLDGFHAGVGLTPTDPSLIRRIVLTWALTTEVGVGQSASTSYRLRFFGLVMERRNAKGEIIARRQIVR